MIGKSHLCGIRSSSNEEIMDDRHIPNEKNGSSGELSHTPIDVEDSTKLDRTTQGSKDNGATHQFNEQTHYMDTKRIILVFLACSTVDFVALMDQTTLAVAIVAISSDLRAGSNSSWFSNAYFVTSTSFQLLYGRISDILGRKQCLLCGLFVFFLGSLASSLAQNSVSLIIFRAITGIGGGGLMSIAQIIVGDVVPLRERGKYQGILGAVVAIANGVGPLIGGALSSSSSSGGWRNIFRLNLPLSALCAACIFYLMPLRPVVGSWEEKVKSIDYFGSFLTLSSSTLFILGLTWAGAEYSWRSVHVLVPMLLGVGLGILFVLWQWKGAKLPLMPLFIFKKRMVVGACITMAINGWIFLSQIYYIPQFYQLVFRYSAIKSGALLLPVTLAQTLMSTLSGLFIKWGGRYRECILIGWVLWSVGLGLFSTLDINSGAGKQVGFAILTGAGVGCTLQPALVAIQSAVDRKSMAVVTSTRNFLRNLGGSIGLALTGTIILNTVQSTFSNQLERPLLSQDQIKELIENPTSASLLSQINPSALESFQEAYRRGFRRTFILMAGLAAFAFFVALVMMPQVCIDRIDDEIQKKEAKERMQQSK